MLRKTGIIFVAKLTSYALRLGVPLVLVRLLTVYSFGEYRQFFLLQTLAATLLQMGMIQGLYYFIPRDPSRQRMYLWHSMMANVAFVTGGFVLVIPWRDSLAQILGMPVLKAHYFSLWAYTMVMLLVLTIDAFFLARGSVLTAAALDIGGQLGTSVVTIAAAAASHDLSVVIKAIVAGRVFHLAVSGIATHRALGEVREEPGERYGLGKQIRYSVVLGLGGMLGTLGLRIHEVVVSHVFGPKHFAVYSVGCTDLPVLSLFAQSLIVVVLPQFAVLEKERRYEEMARLWRRFVASLAGLGIPFVAFLVIFARPIVMFLFTAAYSAAVPVFRINSLGKLALLYNPGVVLRAQDRNGAVLATNAAVLLVSVPALLYATHEWGLVGAISVHGVCQMGGRLIQVILAGKRTKTGLSLFPGVWDVVQVYRDALEKSVSYVSRILRK